MDEDTHLCLNCHMTIIGLDNYIIHRKNHCAVSTSGTLQLKGVSYEAATEATISTQSLPVIVSPTQLHVTAVSIGSPILTVSTTTTPATPCEIQQQQEQSVGLYNNPTKSVSHDESAKNITELKKCDLEDSSIQNFLSSLDLQARDPREEKQESKGNEQANDERLKIAHILNEIDFSSDSDALPSDVDDLLDFANEDEDTRTYKRVPRGGKWGPSEKAATSGKIAAAQSRGKFKVAASPGKGGKHAGRTYQYGGKGSKLRSHSKHHAHTKLKSYARIEKNNEEEVVLDKHAKEIEEKAKCKTCNKEFSCPNSYERHLKSEFHAKHVNPPTPEPVKIKPDIECPICEKVFNTKYNFARHLASSYHTKREKGLEPMVLDESIQVLLLRQSPVQCLVCSFYCNEMEIMLQHLESKDHKNKCSELTGPLTCLRCKFQCTSNELLIEHYHTAEHEQCIKSSHRPCIVKEVRWNVKCLDCDKEFHSASRLEQHVQVYHQKNSVGRPPKQKGIRYKMPCPFCNKEWNSTFQLNIHIRRRHTNEKPYPCNACGVAFTDVNSLKAHEATKKHINQQIFMGILPSPSQSDRNKQSSLAVLRSTSKNVCKYCNLLSASYSDAKNHCKAEHPEKMYACRDCYFETHMLESFERHKQTESHIKRMKRLQSKGRDFECMDCGRAFGTNEALQVHQIKHNTVISETQLKNNHGGQKYVGLDDRFIDFWERVSKTKKKHEREKCMECNKEFVVSNLLNHLRRHSNTFPFECSHCDRKFPSSSSLRRHIHSVHLDIKLHECNICGQRFQRRSYLLRHLMKDHKDVTVDCPFTCDFCGKAFPLKHMLTTHANQHRTEKPFACTFDGCKKSYKTKAEFKIHQRIHTGENPFVCEFCGYSGNSRQKLTRHQRIHTQERNHSCQYCSYKAQNTSHLHRHMRIHIGTRPYKCPYCEFACNTHENIRKHIMKTKKHKGLPCYPCSLCDYGTNFALEFGEHMEKVHNQKIQANTIPSVVAGIFVKEEDKKDIPEGGRVIPVREKGARLRKINMVKSEQELMREDYIENKSEEGKNTVDNMQLGENMDFVEVDSSTLMELDKAGDVQWMDEDGSIVMCTNQQFYDKLKVVVLDNRVQDDNITISQGDKTKQQQGAVLDLQPIRIAPTACHTGNNTLNNSVVQMQSTQGNTNGVLDNSIREVVVEEEMFEDKILEQLPPPIMHTVIENSMVTDYTDHMV